jgi:hypothetical protein
MRRTLPPVPPGNTLPDRIAAARNVTLFLTSPGQIAKRIEFLEANRARILPSARRGPKDLFLSGSFIE